MPNTSSPISAPLTSRTSIPSQQRITRTRFPTDPTTLHLGEMTLEEGDLMFSVNTWGVGCGMHHTEMVVDLSASNSSLGLGNQLGTTHGLPVPEGGFVDGNLCSEGGSGVGGVLVAAIDGNIAAEITRTMLVFWSGPISTT